MGGFSGRWSVKACPLTAHCTLETPHRLLHFISMPRTELATGVNLHYELSGPSERETVVFVNGLTMTLASWELLSREFADAYQVLRYDCRGQGESDKPVGPYPPEQHAEDLVGLLDALELKEAHLVGLSNGGLVSMLTAAQLGPKYIKSVTTIDSLLSVDPLLRTILRGWKAALTAGGPGLRFDVATPWVWGHSFLNAHLDEVLAFRELAVASDGDAVGYLIDGAERFESAGDRWQSYAGPSLSVVGEEDLLTPVRYSQEIVKVARQGRLVILEKAGHAAPVERPEAVAKVVRSFLEETVLEQAVR